MGKRIAQIILAVIIIGLVYVVYDQISTPIRFNDEKKLKETAIIERIKDIRLAERAFRDKYQRFTGDFDTLINFVLNENLELERKIVDEDDSVGLAMLKKEGKKNVEIFTIAVRDTIFSPRKLSAEAIKNLRYIPGSDKKVEYILEAATLMTESKVVIPVVECRIPYISYLDTVKYRQEIVNLVDDQVKNFNRYPGIKFGSMESGSNESGNWE